MPGLPVAAALPLILLISATIGLIHGLLITKLDLQPFVVTLCGLLIYRGLARRITKDSTMGLGVEYDDGLRRLAQGEPFSWPTLILIAGVILAALALLKLVRGRSPDRDPPSAETFQGLSPSWVSLLCGGLMIGFSFLSKDLMRNFGWLLFSPLFVVFVALGLKHNAKRVLKPLIALVVAAGIFVAIALTLAPLFRTIAVDEVWTIGVLTLSGKAVRTVIMLTVFLSVGSLMGALGGIVASVSSVSVTAKSLLPLVILSAVFGLLGMTSLADTRVPSTLLILIVLAIIAAIFLNRTIFGRYLLAMGRNEEAARYSGINTSAMTVLAYIICSITAGIGGILFSLDINSVQPSGFGNFYELYAIAAAVLGGCSLRGGEGSILGVVIGAAVMRVLYNAINILGIDTTLEFAIIGTVILAGAITDVVVKRIVARKAAIAEAAANAPIAVAED